MNGHAISVTGLRKTYGPIQAVAGVDLAVDAGEVFALLGPNGARNTTFVEILEGYRTPTAGDNWSGPPADVRFTVSAD